MSRGTEGLPRVSGRVESPAPRPDTVTDPVAEDMIENLRLELALMQKDRDGLAVVLSRAKRVLHRAESQKTWRDDGWEVPSIDVQTAIDILSADPGAVLAERDRHIRADAWDEGFDSGHYAADWESRDCGCRDNPYRVTPKGQD